MSKYKSKKIAVDGITFDSQLEAEYYQQLKWEKQLGEIKDFSLQPKYLLQEAFEKDGKKHRKIEYFADFEIENIDGTATVIDVKGFETTDFKLKKKMFDNRYRHLKLMLITKAPKKFGGGWIELEALKKLRKINNNNYNTNLWCGENCDHGKRLNQIGESLSELKNIQKVQKHPYNPPTKCKSRRNRTAQEKV